MTNSSRDMGYQRANLTWPQDPFLWNEMDINVLKKEKFNSQQRELENIT